MTISESKHVLALPAAMVAGALGICLMGAYNSTSSQDANFAPAAMSAMLQSVANAQAAESGPNAKVASKLESDEMLLASQLASLSSQYGIKVDTTLPKADASSASFQSDQASKLQKLIAIMEAERSGGNATQLQNYAAESIPVLRQDLDAVTKS